MSDMARNAKTTLNRMALGVVCLVGAVLALAFGMDADDGPLLYVVAALLLLAALFQFAVVAIRRGVNESR